MTRQPWQRSLWTTLTVIVLAVPAVAALQSSNYRPFLHGVDQFGNPSAQIGSNGYGKIYKDTNTNVLVSIGGAMIQNHSRRRAVFTDLGGVLHDPFNGNNYPITSDQQLVAPPLFGLSLSTIVQVYNPAEL